MQRTLSALGLIVLAASALIAGVEAGQVGVPALGQLGGQGHLQLLGPVGMLLAIGAEPLVPLGLELASPLAGGAEVLEGLLQRPDTWPELGRRGTEYVRHEHEMHQIAARTLALYGVGFAQEAAPHAESMA